MESAAEQVKEDRFSSRKNMFLAADLNWGSERAPVTIRNMSSSGALIDCALIPAPNSLVQLTRGEYVVEGRVAWSKAKRLGVRFTSQVSVAEWMAPVNATRVQQPQRPDSVIVPLRPHFPISQFPGTDQLRGSKRAISEDLLLVRALIQRAGDNLASDPDVLQNHSVELQSFDLAMQMISALQAEATGISEQQMGVAEREHIRRSCSAALSNPSH